LGLLTAAPSAQAAVLYTTITEFTSASPGSYNPLGPSLSANGTVAYIASDGNGFSGVYTGSGGALTTIADTSSGMFRGFGTGGAVNISDNGLVGFDARLSGNDFGVYTGRGGALTTIADTTSGNFSVLVSGGVNDSGEVSFQGQSSSAVGIYKGAGGALTPIAQFDPNSPVSYDSFGAFPGINNSGVVAFGANSSTEVYTGSGGAVATLVANNSGPIDLFLAPVINNSGSLATAVSLDNGGSAVYSGPNLGTLVADSSGPVFDSFGTVSLNNKGAVAFASTNKDMSSGIYIQNGSGGFTTVAQTGQSFLGSTISSLDFGLKGFNDNGEVAFHAVLADGRSGIYRASTVATPEPSTWAMMLLGALGLVVWRRRHKDEVS
jgi:hypothetical protein